LIALFADAQAVLGDDLIRMVETLERDLRGLRDRAILLVDFAGGLRRSGIAGLDCGPDHTEDGSGWVEILDQGLIIRVHGRTRLAGARLRLAAAQASGLVGSRHCRNGFELARIAHGPLFRRITSGGRKSAPIGITTSTSLASLNLNPEVGVAGFREVLGPQARKRMLEGTQL
jgi:hypothetical protein